MRDKVYRLDLDGGEPEELFAANSSDDNIYDLNLLSDRLGFMYSQKSGTNTTSEIVSIQLETGRQNRY